MSFLVSFAVRLLRFLLFSIAHSSFLVFGPAWVQESFFCSRKYPPPLLGISRITDGARSGYPGSWLSSRFWLSPFPRCTCALPHCALFSVADNQYCTSPLSFQIPLWHHGTHLKPGAPVPVWNLILRHNYHEVRIISERNQGEPYSVYRYWQPNRQETAL